MSKLKCLTVGKAYETFFTVGKVYPADSDACVTDNESSHDEDFTWELEVDGVTVMSECCNEDSDLVATFEIVEG